jgi:hypothetical protein
MQQPERDPRSDPIIAMSSFAMNRDQKRQDVILGERPTLDWRCVMLEVVLKRFEKPDDIREFEKGRFEIVRLGGVTIGRATYQPGWRWSVDVGPATGATSCQVEHVGMVVSGCATAAMDDGRIIEMRAGDIFYVPPGHDSWVVGDEPYVSLHFLGADDYARKA